MPQRSPLTTPLWEFISLSILLIADVTGASLFGVETIHFLNIAGPLCLTALLGCGCARMVRLDSNSISCPHVL